MCSAQIGPSGRLNTYSEYATLAALIINMLDRLYDETSRVRSALRSIGRLLTAKTTVEIVPARSGMSMPRTLGATSARPRRPNHASSAGGAYG